MHLSCTNNKHKKFHKHGSFVNVINFVISNTP